MGNLPGCGSGDRYGNGVIVGVLTPEIGESPLLVVLLSAARRPSRIRKSYTFHRIYVKNLHFTRHLVMFAIVCIYAMLREVVSSAALSEAACIYPGSCLAPVARYSVVEPVTPRRQWGDDGGYCGSLSIQSIALTYGAWVSEDLIRKSTIDGGGHGDPDHGWEILHTNIEKALSTLKFNYTSWDHVHQPRPQGLGYLRWLKNSLARGHPVVWFVMCKGDSHDVYGLGVYDHIEPVWGLYSNSSLQSHGEQQLPVYHDDVIVHGSDWGPDGNPNKGYFRRLSSILDTTAMDGNCAIARPGWGKAEMYPCINSDIAYGTAILGPMDPRYHSSSSSSSSSSVPLRVHLTVNGISEPDLRRGAKPALLHGTVRVEGVECGKEYQLYRWDDLAQVPEDGNYERSAYSHRTLFQAHSPSSSSSHPHVSCSSSFVYTDPVPFSSSGATYYRAALAPK